MVAEVEALVLGGWPAAAVRHVARIAVEPRCASACVPCNAGAPRAASSPPDRSQALSVELVAFLRTEKRCDPRASAPELVRRARERGIVPVDQKIDRTSVWRACRRLGLPTRQRPHKREGDTRRWQYAERMQTSQALSVELVAFLRCDPRLGDGTRQRFDRTSVWRARRRGATAQA